MIGSRRIVPLLAAVGTLAAIWFGCMQWFLPAAAAQGLTVTGVTPVWPIPAGYGRIWVYRDAGVYDGIGTPYVRLNGMPIGVSQPDGSFYRDVPAGSYRLTVDNVFPTDGEATDVGVAAGQQAFVKILPSNNLANVGGRRDSGERTVFYAWQIPPYVAQREMAGTLFYGANLDALKSFPG